MSRSSDSPTDPRVDYDWTASATYALAAGEEAQSIARVESGDSSFFVVGVTKIDPDQAEPDEGRFVVLQENAGGDVLVASETAIAGCPYAVLALGEGLVATAINSQVCVPEPPAKFSHSRFSLTPRAGRGVEPVP